MEMKKEEMVFLWEPVCAIKAEITTSIFYGSHILFEEDPVHNHKKACGNGIFTCLFSLILYFVWGVDLLHDHDKWKLSQDFNA
jgi:hypothetical protein